MLETILAFAGGYLLGSIPFAYVITTLFGLGDIRKVGSGNVGATNVLRTGNKWAAALTLVGDVGKGIVAVLLAKQFGDVPAMAAGLGAFVGHVFPVWLKFRGGKGIATCIGIVAILSWPVALMTFATWLVVVAVTRISSLSALIAAVAAPIYMAVFDKWHYAVGAALLTALIFVTHRENIRRLLAGEEPRIGAKKDAPPSAD